MTTDIKVSENISYPDLQLWVRVVMLDYNFDNHSELAQLVTEHSGKYCSEQDINNYFNVCFHEDFELESRKQEIYGCTE